MPRNAPALNASALLCALGAATLTAFASPAAAQSTAWEMPTDAVVPSSPPASTPPAAAIDVAVAKPRNVAALAPRRHASDAGWPSPDAIADDDEPSGFGFGLSASTLAPLSIGAQATLEVPGRLMFQFEGGYMPEAYGSAINGILQNVGVYNAEVGSLIDGALDGAVMLRGSVGWRPFESAGFEVWGGYTSLSLMGSVSPGQVADLVGGDFAGDVAARLITGDVALNSQLHNVHVALGWRWTIIDHIVIRANVGYMQTLASSSSVDIPGQDFAAALATPIVDKALDDVFTSHVKMPTVGLAAGFRF